MEKINMKNVPAAELTELDVHNGIVDTSRVALRYLAEKVNEIIDWINNHPHV
jgi:hypothetical protein